jgi:hypothetical protein
LHGLPWWDEADELGFVGTLLRPRQGYLVDGHLARVVYVKEQLSAAVCGGVCFDPGTDLDGLLAAFLLRAGLFASVFLAQQHEPNRERAHGADR